MKIRNGFVSNSSSSSFIVAAKDRKHTKIKITIEVDLSKFVPQYCKSKPIATTVEELREIFREHFDFEEGAEDCEFFKGKFNAARKAIEKGEVIIVGSFSDEDDDPIGAFLCENGIKSDKSSGIEVIHSEEGY